MIYIGTAGYGYEDWKGQFYPERMPSGKMLEFYSRYFKVVELNVTWHTVPSLRTLEAIAEKTGEDFHFLIKANRKITHEREEADPSVFRMFNRAVEVFEKRGKLGCVLAQFPWEFKHNEANYEHLLRIRHGIECERIVVEFRHNSWLGREIAESINKEGFSVCAVDEPQLKEMMPPLIPESSDIGYVRFHGRNAKIWWDRKREPWERYNYIYSRSELEDWIPRILKIEPASGITYLIFNNHYMAKAVRNAQMMSEMLPDDIVKMGDEAFGTTLFPADY